MESLWPSSTPGNPLTIFLFILLLDLQRRERVIGEGRMRTMGWSNWAIATTPGAEDIISKAISDVIADELTSMVNRSLHALTLWNLSH
jgi:hypothetical protein